MKAIDKGIGVVLGVIIAVVVIAAMLVAVLVLQGFMVHMLWGWLVVPVFGFAPLTVAQAAACALFIAYFSPEREGEKAPADRLIELLVKCAVFLAIGYPLHLVIT